MIKHLKHPVSIGFTDTTMRKLKSEAKKLDISVSALVNMLIAEHFKERKI